jgi:LmbE family N-acetylglucosaminyl deacetylase
MVCRTIGIVLCVMLALRAFAQDTARLNLYQALLDLSQDGVLMDLSAHPDDEDGASLAYYRMHFGVKTYSILFTRGEGGQNETGPELYEELGVLRSRETKAAGRILGAEVHFLNLLDFGYSKTASEALRKWGGQTEVLRRLVYVIRKYKPDVIFTNHNTIDGHGHHQAVAVTAIAAFDAAADSTMFPDQLREPGITVWQPRKLYSRIFRIGSSPADVSNPIDEVDSARGKGYIDIATEALRMHKTQGMDHANLRAFTHGKSLYRLIRQNSLYEKDTSNFFSGIDFFRDPSIAGLKPLRSQLNQLRISMPADSMLGIISSVIMECDSLNRYPSASVLARRMLAHWIEECGNLAETVSGLTIAWHLRDSVLIPGQRTDCDANVSALNSVVSGVRWSFRLPGGWNIEEEPATAPYITDHSDDRHFELVLGDNASPTLPKTVTQYQGLENRQEMTASVSLLLDGFPVELDFTPRFEIAPREFISVDPPRTAILRSRLRDGVSFHYTIRNFLPHKTAGRVGLRTPSGWRGENAQFVISQEDSSASGDLLVLPPTNAVAGEHTLHIRTELASAPVTISIVDARIAGGVRLGVIRSYDNTVEAAAKTLGVECHMISDDEIEGGDLSKYSTIIIDIRAYLVRDALRRNYTRLLAYVRDGGTLLVMYQRDREWRPEYAPYPFTIGRLRVCSETAPIRILAPDHPLMKFPNVIGDSDWRGWIQERGLHFPSDVPDAYTRLLSTADPDEPQLTTGYLAAHYGKGWYVYTSFVWYRQLKEGNAGAFRCFANMISLPWYRPGQP